MNVRGLIAAEKKHEVEQWMEASKTEIMVLQETHVGDNRKDINEKYTWFYGGVGEERTIREGVAVVIKNEMRNYVQDVVMVSERIIILKLRGTVPITVIGVYAPTALATEAKKTMFYKTLKNEARKAKNRGAVFLMGNFNARVQAKISEEENMVGPYTFDRENIRISTQEQNVIDNRENMLEFVANSDSIIASTFFKKQERKLITYKEKRKTTRGSTIHTGSVRNLGLHSSAQTVAEQCARYRKRPRGKHKFRPLPSKSADKSEPTIEISRRKTTSGIRGM